MSDYRVYYLDRHGKIFAASDLPASNDDEAISLARGLAASRASAFELWQSTRRVHVGAQAPVPTPSGADQLRIDGASGA